MTHVSNFTFLKEYDSIFYELTSRAEQVFSAEPNTTLMRLRQFVEAFAQDLALRCAVEVQETTTQADLVFKLCRRIRLDSTIPNQLQKESEVISFEKTITSITQSKLSSKY